MDPAFHLNADPDSVFRFYVELDPAAHQSDSNLRPLVYRPPPLLHFEPQRLHCERPSPLRLHFEILKLQNFYFNADPAFTSNAEPDPVFKKMHIHADPDLQPCFKSRTEYYETGRMPITTAS